MKEALLVLLVTCLLLVLEAAQGYHQGPHHGTPGHHGPPGHHGTKGGHQGHKHKGGHHKGHHGPHHDTHNGPHGPRSDRIRRQKELPQVVTDADESSTVGPSYPCTTNDNCTSLLTNSECNNEECVCTGPYPVLDALLNQCFKELDLAKLGANATCQSDRQCSHADSKSNCDPVKKLCVCSEGYSMKEYPEMGFTCVEHSGKSGNVDPTMIIILGVMAAMFVIICVVLRLFSKARFRETRSIFNTPNPRLMNASLFKDSKLLSPAHDARRGSRASVRPPSRAPSVTSVNISGNRSRTGSRNGSIAAQGRRGSAISTASAAGSTTGGGGRDHHAKTPSPIKESKKETSVAIETVD